MNAFVTGLLTGVLSIGLIAAVTPTPRVSDAPLDTPGGNRKPAFRLDVFLRDAANQRRSVDSDEVRAVMECLRPVLARVTDPELCRQAVIETLGTAFPGRLTVDEQDPFYKALWDSEGMRWRIYCCENTNLEVDVDGTIVDVPVGLDLVLR